MDFEFDPAKSAANKAKHGIDFDEAKVIWDDPLGFRLPAASLLEVRERLIGLAQGKLWAACFTLRGRSARIISVRRARDNERTTYEERGGPESESGDA
jgi:uncharacterized protein